MAPALAMTLLPRPVMRIFRPLKSPVVVIFFLNHPAICGAIDGPGRGTRLNGAYASSQSLSPSPCWNQAAMPSGFMPNGTV